jgi:hypothetical protein
MLEILVAAAVPALAAWMFAGHRRFGDQARRAVRFWFIPAALVWYAPCWLTGGSPGGFDYLFEDVVPWRKPGFSAGNALLSDSVLQFVPWREAARDSIAHGAMPYLNRFAGSGAPLWENPQAAVAFPLNIAGLPFSGFAWPLFASIAKILISLCGTYAFLRGRGASQHAAIAGAFAFSFGAFATAFSLFPHTNVTVLLPWLLVAIDACGLSARAVPWMAIVLACMILGGHPESVMHSAVVAIPLAATIVVASKERLLIAQRYLMGGVCGLALSAPLLLPFAQYLPYSERVARLAEEREVIAAPAVSFSALVPFAFAGHLVPATYPEPGANFAEAATQYVGVAAFALALFAAIAEWRRPFWAILFLIAAFFAFSSPIANAVISRIPIVELSMNGRLRFVCAFIAAVLAAKGVDLIRARPRLFATIVGATLVFVALTIIGSWSDYGPFATRVAISGAGAIVGGSIAFAVALRPALYLLPLAIFVDLAALLIPYHAPAARSAFYPKTPAIEFLQRELPPARFVAVGWTLLPNSAAMLGLEDIAVHDPVGFAPYLDLLGQGGYDRRIYHNLFTRVPPSALLQALGVRYIVLPPDGRSPTAKPVYHGEDAVIFAVPGARSRLSTTAGATVESVEYRPNLVRLVVNAGAEATVGSGEVALPGWWLSRDGEPWPFQSSALPLLEWKAPAGRSVFELRYRPAGLESGLIMSLFGVALLALHHRRAARPQNDRNERDRGHE